MKNQIKIVGQTNDGKFVVQGTFRLIETYGIPLDVIINYLDENNFVVDWIDFLKCSMQAKWSLKTTLNKIEVELTDVKGYDYANQVITRLNEVLRYSSNGKTPDS